MGERAPEGVRDRHLPLYRKRHRVAHLHDPLPRALRPWARRGKVCACRVGNVLMGAREVGRQLRGLGRADARATPAPGELQPRIDHGVALCGSFRVIGRDDSPPCIVDLAAPAQRPWSGQRGSIKPRGKAKGATARGPASAR